MSRPIRLAARALILHDDRLLLVNAYPQSLGSDLWCAPGGGADPHHSLPENLMREVHEETGLEILVGAPVLINEFHDPSRDFHQVDVYFRCQIVKGQIVKALIAGGQIGGGVLQDWRDPMGVVTERRFFSRAEIESRTAAGRPLRFKPDSLASAAWGAVAGDAMLYDPLEPIVR